MTEGKGTGWLGNRSSRLRSFAVQSWVKSCLPAFPPSPHMSPTGGCLDSGGRVPICSHLLPSPWLRVQSGLCGDRGRTVTRDNYSARDSDRGTRFQSRPPPLNWHSHAPAFFGEGVGFVFEWHISLKTFDLQCHPFGNPSHLFKKCSPQAMLRLKCWGERWGGGRWEGGGQPAARTPCKVQGPGGHPGAGVSTTSDMKDNGGSW